jgi:hypothetical protein
MKHVAPSMVGPCIVGLASVSPSRLARTGVPAPASLHLTPKSIFPALRSSKRLNSTPQVFPQGDLQVCKKFLQQAQKSPEVDQAAEWARELVRMEARGPGDLPNAMDRIERRHGLPPRTLWALRYRTPKDIFASVYNRLRAAYEGERQRQIRKLQHELILTTAIAGASDPAVAAAEAVLGEMDLVSRADAAPGPTRSGGM